MKKAIGILIALAVVALVAVFFLFPKKQVVAPGVTLENYVPKSTVAFYSLRDMQGTWNELRNSQFYREISSLPVWKEVQTQQAVGNFLKAFKEGFGFELTEQRIMDVVGDELAIGVLMGAPADPEPKLLILTRTGTKTQLAEMAGRLLDKAKSAGNQKIESWKYDGFDIQNVKSADPAAPELNYVFMDNVLAVGVGKTRGVLENVVDLYKGKRGESISSSENFKKFVTLSSDIKGKNVGLFFMDFEQIAKAVDVNKVQVPGGANLGQTLSLLKLIGGVSTLSHGLFTKIYVLPNKQGMDANTRALWEVKPQTLTSIKYVPEGTVLYSVTNSMDVKKLWGMWKENLLKQAPSQAKTVLDAITQAQTNLGMTIEGDLLPWIGDEIAYTFNDVNLEGVFPIPKMALMIKVTDKAQAQAFIDRMVEYANKQSAAAVPPATAATPPSALAAEGQPATAPQAPTPPVAPVQIKFEDMSHEGVAIKFISVPLMGKGLTPGYAFLGDYLVLSTSTTILEKMVDVSLGKSNSLQKDSNYLSIAAELPEKTNQMGYVNTQHIFDIGTDICNWIISFQQLNLPPGTTPGSVTTGQSETTAKVLRETVIPLLKAMKVVRVIGINTTYTSEGIEQIIATHLQDAGPVSVAK